VGRARLEFSLSDIKTAGVHTSAWPPTHRILLAASHTNNNNKTPRRRTRCDPGSLAPIAGTPRFSAPDTLINYARHHPAASTRIITLTALLP
jgi:hypothetical protein